jgi:hypothetical protein
MNTRMAVAALCLCAPCWAQVAAPAPAASAATEPGEPKVERIVTEDDRVRIDELRVRGQTRRVVVQSKVPGAPAYEIGTNASGRDGSQEGRTTEGRSLWRLFAF